MPMSSDDKADSAASPSASPSDARRPRPGDVVAGKFEVERVLGAGGMGVVVAARICSFASAWH